MERLRLLYEQIEESRRLMLSGTLPHLRLALILLDNAAELIMYRELSDQFAKGDFYARMRERSRREGVEDLPALKYTDEERHAAEREFRPMVKPLSQNFGMITQKQAIVLRVCHEMRRDAFHRGEMNPAILRPITQLLLLTVADIARDFPIHSYSVAGGAPSTENADFLARFALQAYDLASDGSRDKIYSELVEGIAFDSSLRETLSQDLEQRIDSTREGLSYLNNDSLDRNELDERLRYSQFWRERGADVAKKADEKGHAPKDDLDIAYREWSRNPGLRFTMDKLERWRRQASAIVGSKHPADALAKYRAFERRFAPLEEEISKAVADYDDYINMLI